MMEIQLAERINAIFPESNNLNRPGCCIGVVRNGQLVYAQGYGLANLEHKIPITPTSVFNVCSMSKQFTAFALALLEEDGQVNVESDVHEYIPELHAFESPIKIFHLIHHTSGLPDYLGTGFLSGWADDAVVNSSEALSRLKLFRSLNHQPGEEYIYSNTNYLLLGIIIERLSGLTLRKFTHEKIFKPLGMVHTHFQDDHKEIVPERAEGYRMQKNGDFRTERIMNEGIGDGNLLTSIKDLVLWDRNFYSNQLGKGGQGIIERTLQCGQLNSGKAIDYAWGLNKDTYRGLKVIRHAGGFPGFRSEGLRFPEQSTSIFCLANDGRIEPTLMAQRVADICLQAQFPAFTVCIPTAPMQVRPAEKELDRFTGTYISPTSETQLKLTRQESKFHTEYNGEELCLIPESATRMVSESDKPFPTVMEFEIGCSGTVRMKLTVQPYKPDFFQKISIIPINPSELSRFTGKFISPELDVIYKLFVRDNHLILRVGLQEYALEQGSTDMFLCGLVNIYFERDEQNNLVCFLAKAKRIRGIRFTRVE